MKKALIVTALAGFVRSFLTHDIELLQSMGYEVHCAANINHPGSDGMLEYFEKNNVIFHQVGFSSYKPISKDTYKAYRELKKLRDSESYDVVHCHTPIAGFLTRLLFRKKRRFGCKIIYTVHGFYFHKKSSRKVCLIYYNIEKLMSKYCDAIITINNEDFKNAKKMHCKKVFHINGVGVDTERFRNTLVDREKYRTKLGLLDNDIVVLTVGELSERKNQKVIIEALGMINDPRLILIHCGNAMNSAATTGMLLKLAREKKVRMRLLGLRKDIPEICKCADIGTISSTREGLGMAAIEMLASGLPVVGSNVHGIVDYLVDGYNGFLADPFNPEDFANKISMLRDKNKRISLSKNCSESVKMFDNQVSFKQMKKIYQRICL